MSARNDFGFSAPNPRVCRCCGCFMDGLNASPDNPNICPDCAAGEASHPSFGFDQTMTQPSSSKLFREIVSAGKEFQIAVKIRDAAAVASFYTEDAQLLSPEQEFIVGRQAIQSFWQRICAAPIKGADLETVEVQGRGDTATEVSRFTLHGEHGPILERAEYMVVWRRVNGSWKLHRDGYKSSRRSVDPR